MHMTPGHILLVDDEDDIREVATLSLEAIGGWRVSGAGCGADAIAMARAERPDAILLDVMMPGVDGPETFRLLQDDPRTREIPVILLTARAQSADRARFAVLGVAGMLAKPFDPMTLSEQIAAILADREAAPAAVVLDAGLRAIFQQHADDFQARVATLEQALVALAAGCLDDELRLVAKREAHKLVGSLGTFGLTRGTDLAREVEQGLAQAHGPVVSDHARLSRCVVALRSELDGEIAGQRRLGQREGATPRRVHFGT
jgi:two-component system alkaline phosphatase synthesis response regulator PhoP